MDILQQTIKLIDEDKSKYESEETYKKFVESMEGIYIYISFDLTNSTLFKSRHRDLWPEFISSFYESVVKEFGLGKNIIWTERNSFITEYSKAIQKTGGFHLWKLIGDEVLLYHKVVSKDELYDTILFIDSKRKVLVHKTIEAFLEKKSFQAEKRSNGEKKESTKEEEYKRLFRQYFEIKTTVWIGSCANNASEVSLNKPNVIYDSMALVGDELNQIDFLGPDIDEGFRLCKYSEKKQMIVSPKLVYLLLLAYEKAKNHDKLSVINLNFRIVNYAEMSGVWEQRLYPLIMFCQNQDGQSDSLDLWKKQFEYDSFETSFLYKNIEEYGETFFQNERFSIRNLKKIYQNVVRDLEMKSMLETLETQEESVKELAEEGMVRKGRTKFEFHISCLCYDNEEEKLWVTNHKTHGWSFGCIEIKDNEDVYEAVEKAYEEKYDLNIKIEEDSPLLSFYTAKRVPVSEGNILGVVVLVENVKTKEIKDNVNARWMTFEEAEALEGTKLKEFDSILAKAQEIIEKEKK